MSIIIELYLRQQGIINVEFVRSAFLPNTALCTLRNESDIGVLLLNAPSIPAHNVDGNNLIKSVLTKELAKNLKI